MNIKLILLASTTIFFLSTAAFATDKETYQTNTKIERDTDGNYSEKTKTSKTEANGTTSSSEKKVTIDIDSKGNTNKSRITKNIIDPKGFGNKHMVTTRDTEKTKDGQVTTTHLKTVNGKTVEGTNDSYKSETRVQKDVNGNYEEKDITTNTDAKGTTTTSEKNATVDVGVNGDINKSTTTKEVTDPKGILNNKTTVTTSNTEKVQDGMVNTSQEVKVDGKTVDSKTATTPQK